MKTIICLDFDGVLNAFRHNFITDEYIPEEPIPGAREWCWQVWNSGKADLIISSGRCRSEAGMKAVEVWLEKWEFPPIPVSPIKPVAHVYIDDRAYRFEGNWSEVNVDDFVRFRPWWDETGEWVNHE